MHVGVCGLQEKPSCKVSFPSHILDALSADNFRSDNGSWRSLAHLFILQLRNQAQGKVQLEHMPRAVTYIVLTALSTRWRPNSIFRFPFCTSLQPGRGAAEGLAGGKAKSVSLK